MKKLFYLFTIYLFTQSICFAQSASQENKIILKSKIVSELNDVKFNHSICKQKSVKSTDYILFEDFAKFIYGSETEPDSNNIIDTSTGEIFEEYTAAPGWHGESVYQAGQCAYIDINGYISTPTANLSDNDGKFIVSFRAKANSDNDKLKILMMSPGESYARKSISVDLSNKWETYSIAMFEGIENGYIQIWSYKKSFFIDDICIKTEGLDAPENLKVTEYTGTSAKLSWDAVEYATAYLVNVYYYDNATRNYVYHVVSEYVTTNQYEVKNLNPENLYLFDVITVQRNDASPLSKPQTIEPTLDAPILTGATNYTSTSCTLNWIAVENASSYVLNVYYKKNETPNYVIKNKEVTENFYNLDKMEQNTVYYYQVAAKMSDGSITKRSEPQAALPKVEKPQVLPATNITDNSFVANWSKANNANTYLVKLYKKHKAVNDESYTFANASFENLNSTGTLESPESLFTSYTFTGDDGAYGWYISNAAKIKGAIGIDNTMSLIFGPAFMYTPKLNIENENNTISLSMDVVSNKDDSLIISFAKIEGKELVEIKNTAVKIKVTPNMTQQTATLSGGNDGYVILLYSENKNNIYFSKITANIELSKDTEFETIIDDQITNETNCLFEDLNFKDNNIYGYDVLPALVINQDNIILGEVSDKMYAGEFSSKRDNSLTEQAYVSIINESIKIYNPNYELVEIYTSSGIKIKEFPTTEKLITTKPSNNGMYLIKIGKKTFKVVY